MTEDYVQNEFDDRDYAQKEFDNRRLCTERV